MLPVRVGGERMSEYEEAGDVVAAHKRFEISFHDALEIMQRDFDVSQEDACYVLFPPMHVPSPFRRRLERLPIVGSWLRTRRDRNDR